MAKSTQDERTKAGGLGLVDRFSADGEEEMASISDDTPPDPALDSALGPSPDPSSGSPPSLSPPPDPGPHYAANSALAATPEVHKESLKRAGRPPKSSSPRGSLPDQMYVPTPRFNTYKSDHPNPNQRSRALWSWWSALQPQQQEQLKAYVYRDWPPLKLQEGTKEQEVGANPNIDTISGVEPIQDDIDFLHRYGCGIYRLRLNKANRDGTQSGTIATVYINGLGTDMKSNPPTDKRINDLAQVDFTNPECASYAAFLRSLGIIPNPKKEDEDMAVTETVTKLTDTIERMAKEASKPAPAAAPTSADMTGQKALEVMAKAAEAGIKITQDANEYAARERQRADEARREAEERVRFNAPAQVPAKDPMEIAISLFDLMNRNRGEDGLLKTFIEMQDKQNQRMEAFMREMASKQPPASTPLRERISDLKELREISELLNPKEDRDDGPGVMDAVGDLGPKWLRPLLPYAPLVGNLLSGFLMRGNPLAAGNPSAVPSAFPGAFPNPAPGPFLVQNQNSQSVPAPTPIAQAGAGAGAGPIPSRPTSLPPEVTGFLDIIRIPFLRYIRNPDMTGQDFAELFIDGWGEELHDNVRQFGPDSLLAAIADYPPIAEPLVAMQAPEERVRTFLKEFCSDRFEEREEGEEGGEIETSPEKVPTITTPPPSPSPATPAA